MVRVKICGITDSHDAFEAVKLGADALGFIFASSPRQITPENARDIIRDIPPFVKSVGVFINEDPATIKDIVQFCGIDLVQFHGDESPALCDEFMPRTIKALRVKDESILESIRSYHGNARALLLDTYSEERAGGTGKSFDWDLAIKIKRMGIPIVMAGGLGPSNIEKAVTAVRPYAVDVNSGVEDRPGKKSHTLMKELFEKITRIRSQEIGVRSQCHSIPDSGS
ncbi:phosphoribosylanthranilate isomerase [Thermodesulfobacteriota bacterium]